MSINPLQILKLPIVIAATLLAIPAAFAQHVHGVAELGIVVEANTVAITLSSPLHDVIGFEHAPENDAQVEKIQQAAAAFSKAEAVFGMPASAECVVSRESFDAPEFFMAVAAPKRAEQDGKHSESSGHGNHSNLNANYEWSCGNVASLDTVTLYLADKLSGVETINLQMLTADGARVEELPGSTRSISLSAR